MAKQKKQERRIFLVVHTPDLTYQGFAVRTEDGFQPIDHEANINEKPWDVPPGAITRLINIPGSDLILATVYTQTVAFLDHAAWDVLRRSALARLVPAFRQTSGFGRMLKTLAMAAPIVIAFYLLMTIGGLQADLQTVARQAETLQLLANQVDLLQQSIDSGVKIVPTVVP